MAKNITNDFSSSNKYILKDDEKNGPTIELFYAKEVMENPFINYWDQLMITLRLNKEKLYYTYNYDY